ncbi:polysaccharide biosynthesis/export family protein [Sphingobacterium composti Ten et al. 2007 non Yoo et al. 2007]|uniref:polysaccharide biosynthesis/export family protein n=1 Tax=Sphingobacterium composti TaxID=363260 RepID=UPI001359BA85|nr:polysaccharide biosynthesis/export family protein [Sphingobacterium composti Ten et al. 2007 non Yoo et al. 2007]
MKRKTLYILFILSLTILSCASRKDLVYFQPSDTVELRTNYENNTPKLQAGDILAISVTADDVRATQPFNQISAYQGTNGTIQSTNPFIPTYAIDNNGFIDFPKLGKIKLAGKTRTEAIDYLRTEVSKYIVSPGISMEIRNFRVTILGEVKSPGTYPINNDRITLLEAIGLAGDLTINGVRKNVLVVREQNGVKSEYRVDLTSRNALNSPVFYLAQNDVVYVEPNGARIQSSKYTQNTSIFVSVASIVIGLITLIVRN